MTDRSDSPPTVRSAGGDRFTAAATRIGGLIPDAMTAAIVLTAAVAGIALLIGNTPAETADAYYRGLWMLLPFTMQMTLILVLSAALAATPFFRRLIVTLSRLPRDPGQTLALAMLTNGALSYCYWGLGLAMGPLVAVHFARQAERRGRPVDFPFLLAAGGAAGAIWQFGFSASAPLLMNTPGHFLEDVTGLMPPTTTIFAPATLIFLPLFLAASYTAARLLLPRNPRPISQFPQACALADAGPDGAAAEGECGADEPAATPAARLESHRLPAVVLALGLAGWLAYHAAVKGGGLDLNSLNTTLLLLCLVFHGSVRSFSRALPAAVMTAWPVIVLYHLYAGGAGLIQHTSVGSDFASYAASIADAHTFPLLTALAAAVVSIFVPSSGGQWVIQGFITTKAAAAVGVSAQRGLLALSVGDHVGNLVSPFWAVIAAGIARIDFRIYIGYNLVYVVLWFVLGVLCFTFLPC